MNSCCFDSQKYFQTMIQIAEETVLRKKPSSDVQTGGALIYHCMDVTEISCLFSCTWHKFSTLRKEENITFFLNFLYLNKSYKPSSSPWTIFVNLRHYNSLMEDLGIRRYVYIRKQYSAIGVNLWSETINSSNLQHKHFRWGTLEKLQTCLTCTPWSAGGVLLWHKPSPVFYVPHIRD